MFIYSFRLNSKLNKNEKEKDENILVMTESPDPINRMDEIRLEKIAKWFEKLYKKFGLFFKPTFKM